MRSPGSAARLLLLAMACGACGPYANENPLAPSPPAPPACPARYGFEDGSLGAWTAPSWPGGLVGMVVDRLHPHCGAYALHVGMTVGGSPAKAVVAQAYFGAKQDLSGTLRRLWVYFPQAPPPTVRLTAVFIGSDMNWSSPSPSSQSGFAAGWTQLSGTYSGTGVAGVLLQFDNSSTSAWSGDAWIDDLDW